MKKMMHGGVAASKMGAVRTAAPSRDGVASKGKTKGTQIKMAKGGNVDLGHYNELGRNGKPVGGAKKGGMIKKKMAYGGKC
jgi:hypothetical protein